MPAPREILELVARFEQQLDACKSGHYNETQVRREFLDPFYKTLGWNIDNEQGFAEAYKDVIHEDQIRIAGAITSPDCYFCVGGTKKFFVETKKPSIFIKAETSPAYQFRTCANTVYAHNERFRRRICGNGNQGRDYLWMFMCHMLAALLHRPKPDLFVRLPATYCVGEGLSFGPEHLSALRA